MNSTSCWLCFRKKGKKYHLGQCLQKNAPQCWVQFILWNHYKNHCPSGLQLWPLGVKTLGKDIFQGLQLTFSISRLGRAAGWPVPSWSYATKWGRPRELQWFISWFLIACRLLGLESGVKLISNVVFLLMLLLPEKLSSLKKQYSELQPQQQK